MIRSEPYRRYVASLPCIHCGMEGYSQCAHANSGVFGKSMGMKAHDLFTFPLCADAPGRVGCHSQWDKGGLRPQDSDKAAMEATWAAITFGTFMDYITKTRGIKL